MKKILFILGVIFLGQFSVQASYCLNNQTNPDAVLACLKIETLSKLFRSNNGLPQDAPKIKPTPGTKAAEVENIIAKIQQFFIDFVNRNRSLNQSGYNYLLGVKSLISPIVGTYTSQLTAFMNNLNKSYGSRYTWSLFKFRTGISEAFRDLKI